MASIKGTKTEQNLLKAFAGESQARNRYTYFAKQARKEGLEQIAASRRRNPLRQSCGCTFKSSCLAKCQCLYCYAFNFFKG